MDTPASIHRHPIHPMLVGVPIAFWVGSLICDVIYHAGTGNLFWKDMAFYLMAGGVIGALAAAVPGFIDYRALANRDTKRIAKLHMILNVCVIVLFLFNLVLRLNSSQPNGMLEVALSVLGTGVLSVSGWLGGQMVYVARVGVSERGEHETNEERAA